MTELVTGAAASGKSEYAERRCMEIATPHSRIYLATMSASDEESKERIRRHRDRRREYTFTTIECPYDVADVSIPKEGACILLECVSNLLANEMFGRGSDECDEAVLAEKIVNDIRSLSDRSEVDNLIIVTNEISSDGFEYDEATERYIRLLGRINAGLSELSDRVTEVVCGIPVVYKG